MTKKTCLKKMGIAVGLGILGNWAATAIANKNYDKHFKKLRDYFELINDTHANLSDTTFCSFNTGAQCDVNGNIALNRFAVIDPWQRFKAKYFIKHELVHARQDEMIARSKDGIKKLNYVILRAYAKHYSKNELQNLIVEFCSEWRSSEEIANAVGKSSDYILNKVLPDMMNLLEKKYDVPRHPKQKYRKKQDSNGTKV